MRIRSGSLIIELYSLDFQDTYLFLKQLLELGSKTIDIVVYPNYFYGRRIDLRNTYIYIAGVYSVVVANPTEELEKTILNTKATAYIVEKDAWIDTRRLDLEKFLKTLDQMVENVNKCSSKAVEVDNIVINTTCLNEVCEDIVVVDYVNAPLTWINPSVSTAEESLVREVASRRPVEYILSYSVCGDKYIPQLIYKPGSGRVVVNYNVSKTCRSTYNYILWSLIDILMK